MALSAAFLDFLSRNEDRLQWSPDSTCTLSTMLIHYHRSWWKIDLLDTPLLKPSVFLDHQNQDSAQWRLFSASPDLRTASQRGRDGGARQLLWGIWKREVLSAIIRTVLSATTMSHRGEIEISEYLEVISLTDEQHSNFWSTSSYEILFLRSCFAQDYLSHRVEV